MDGRDGLYPSGSTDWIGADMCVAENCADVC